MTLNQTRLQSRLLNVTWTHLPGVSRVWSLGVCLLNFYLIMFIITTTLWWERVFNYDGKTDITIQKRPWQMLCRRFWKFAIDRVSSSSLSIYYSVKNSSAHWTVSAQDLIESCALLSVSHSIDKRNIIAAFTYNCVHDSLQSTHQKAPATLLISINVI